MPNCRHDTEGRNALSSPYPAYGVVASDLDIHIDWSQRQKVSHPSPDGGLVGRQPWTFSNNRYVCRPYSQLPHTSICKYPPKENGAVDPHKLLIG